MFKKLLSQNIFDFYLNWTRKRRDKFHICWDGVPQIHSIKKWISMPKAKRYWNLVLYWRGGQINKCLNTFTFMVQIELKYFESL